VYFLNRRLADIKTAQSNPLNVLDRSIYEDELFFQMMADRQDATETEVDIYRSLVHNMMQPLDGGQSKDPDLLIHVRVSFETMLERIQKRGRDFEQIDKNQALYDYYRDLNARYDAWFEQYDRSPKIQIDGDRFDFVEDHTERDTVLDMIDEKLAQLGVSLA
jgi:deoxyadenosine/deoxycytidine kinase